MLNIVNATEKEKIYFSPTLWNGYEIIGIMNNKYGHLLFGGNEKYKFVAFVDIQKKYKLGLSWKPIWTYTVYKFKIVDKKEGNKIYKMALNQKELTSKKGNTYRNLDIIEKYLLD